MYTGPSNSGPTQNPLLPNDFESPDDAEISNEDDSSDDGEEKSGIDDNQNPTEEHQDPNDPTITNEKITSKEEEKQDNIEGFNNSSGTYENVSKLNINWRAAKTTMSNYASGRSKDFKKVVSYYIKAHGGAKSASSTAKSGIRTTINVGRFFNDVSNQGFRETLIQANIDFEGKSAKEILNEVINYLAPVPVTKEDSVARKALISAMEKLYEKFEIEGKDITSLERINKETLNEIVSLQIESYIYERIINDLGSRIESNSTSPADAINKEEEIKEYINSKVETTFSGKDFSTIDFYGINIDNTVEGLFNQCYKVMEDML